MLARFDLWTGDAEIGGGAIAIAQDLNRVQRGARKSAVAAKVPLNGPNRIDFSAPKQTQATRR